MTAVSEHSYKYKKFILSSKSELKLNTSELIETVLPISVTVYENVVTTKSLFKVIDQFSAV